MIQASEEKSGFSVALDRLFSDPDYEDKFGVKEFRAIRDLFLLELARQERFDLLTPNLQSEMALLFDVLGIDEFTNPKEVKKKVKKHFKKLNPHPHIFSELSRIIKNHSIEEDAAEVVEKAARALREFAGESDQNLAQSEEAGDESSKQSLESLKSELGIKRRI